MGILPHIESEIPNLHVVARQELPAAISLAADGSGEIDWEFVRDYSIEAFAEETYAALTEAAA